MTDDDPIFRHHLDIADEPPTGPSIASVFWIGFFFGFSVGVVLTLVSPELVHWLIAHTFT